MSSCASIEAEEEVAVILGAQFEESSEEPPMEEWPSLLIEIPEENKKRLLYEENLYDPGSGEMCTKYIAMSASSVLRHPYYNYPPVVDPGVLKALLKPEEIIIYPDDGQELYLNICLEMNQCPVKIFYKGLIEKEIDLRYYCVNPNSVCPMGVALRFNKIVQVLNLTDNFLNNDSCYHLGEMLGMNSTLTELNLSGCRIGAGGALRLFAGLISNKTLVTLNLDRNQLGDEGMIHMAKAVFEGFNVKEISLSYNSITGKALLPLVEAFETNNKFTHIDLSWNNLFGPGIVQFLNRLSENPFLLDLNLSWNALSGPRVGAAIKKLLTPVIRNLNLSNNKLEGLAIASIISSLGAAKKLVTLDLSYNPLSTNDALKVITKVKMGAVKVQNVYMDSIFVTGEFLNILDMFKDMKSKKTTIVTYGGIRGNVSFAGPDPRELVLNRVEYLCKKNKKRQIDIALVVYQLVKDGKIVLSAKDFVNELGYANVPIDGDLSEELVNLFKVQKSGKIKKIDMGLLADYLKRKWPKRKLPPTPPPEPEPEPQPTKGKGKKDKNKKK